jgi:hypothetical protein
LFKKAKLCDDFPAACDMVDGVGLKIDLPTVKGAPGTISARTDRCSKHAETVLGAPAIAAACHINSPVVAAQ